MSELSTRPAPSDAVAEIARYGSTVLRGAWRREHLESLRGSILDFIAKRRARVVGGVARPNDKLYHTHGAGTFQMVVSESSFDPALLREMFIGSAYHKLCVEHFDDNEFYVGFRRLGFRAHDPNLSDRSFLPYHQDGYGDARIARVLNCWIPLDPGCGREAPGLEVVRDPSVANFPLKEFGIETENAAYDNITVDRARVVEAYGEDCFMAPEFELGDCMVFSEHVIHRTHVTPEMTKPRVNFEFRVYSLKHLAPGASVEEVVRDSYRIA